MKIYLLCVFYLIFLINNLTADVLWLNDVNFKTQISQHTVLFVNFYIPDCEHSKRFESHFEKASKIIKERSLPVTFAKVNCDGSGKETCEQFNVKGFPTIKVFNFGNFVFNYDGPKNSDSLVKFIRLKVEPGSQEIKTPEDLSACLAGLDNVVIGFFHESGTDMEGEYHKLAEALKADYKFAHTYSNKLMTMFGHRNDIVLFRSDKLRTTLEPHQIKFEGQPTLYNVRNWVANFYQGLAGIRTKLNIEQFKAPLVVAYFNVDLEDKASLSAYYRNRVIMAARKFGPTRSRQRTMFAVSDVKEFRRDLEEFGVKLPQNDGEKGRIVVTMVDADHRKYVMNTTFSSESLEQFVADVLGGKMNPYVKSEVPRMSESGDQSHVVSAVGTTFDDVVMDVKKDVLVQLFAPWSSDCVKASNLLEKVAKKLHNETEIRVAKIDATVNHLPTPYVIRGYPTIYLAKKHSKSKPLLYQGEHKVSDYLKFLAENSTEPLLNYDRKGKKYAEKSSIKFDKTEL